MARRTRKTSKFNWYAWRLHPIGLDLEIDTLERILIPLGEAISECGTLIDEAAESGNREYLDAVIDEETNIIESLLGAAFVVCQSYITSVVSRVMSLHKLSQTSGGVDLTTTDGTKANIMKLGSNPPSDCPYTQVQVIDAFANYFKHQEEWQGRWDITNKRAKKTIAILEAVGAAQGSTGNFRSASRILGNETFDDLHVFAGILRGWRQNVHDSYKMELRSRGLI